MWYVVIIVNRGQGWRRFQVPGSNAAKLLVQGSNAAELLVQSSNALKRVQGCPQKAAELQVQGSNAAELLVQGSNALPRVENCRVAWFLSRLGQIDTSIFDAHCSKLCPFRPWFLSRLGQIDTSIFDAHCSKNSKFKRSGAAGSRTCPFWPWLPLQTTVFSFTSITVRKLLGVLRLKVKVLFHFSFTFCKRVMMMGEGFRMIVAWSIDDFLHLHWWLFTPSLMPNWTLIDAWLHPH